MQQIEVGNILEGKITGITKFGAFMDLGNSKTGMVHISEVATTYVKEISEYLKEGQIVKAKVMSITDDGKISLSIKRAILDGANKPSGTHNPKVEFGLQQKRVKDNMSFEDMMNKFKQSSDDKMSDLKKYMDVKQKGSSKKPRARV